MSEISKLEKHGYVSKDDAANLQEKIKNSKLYLKTDYKLNLHHSAECDTHCISYALNESSDSHIKYSCDHNPILVFDRCNLSSQLIETLKRIVSKSNLEEEEKAERCSERDQRTNGPVNPHLRSAA